MEQEQFQRLMDAGLSEAQISLFDEIIRCVN